ncbi:hypothetical protein ElyMa_000914000, partial [Elysia marginata]
MLLAIAEYNHGPQGSSVLKNLFGEPSGVSATRLSQRRTSRRLAASRQYESDKVTHRRVARKMAMKRRQRELEEFEAGPSYSA